MYYNTITTPASTLTVSSSVTVAANGNFNAGAGSLLTHNLNVGGSTATSTYVGSIINNGTFDMYGTAGVIVNLFGIPDASLTGTGATDFYKVVLNKGAVTATALVTPPIFEILSPFTVQGANTVGLLTTHTAGVLKFSGSFTLSNPLHQTAGYAIPALGGVWMNNPNFTILGQNGSPTVAGLFRMTAGTYNIGTSTGNSMGFSANSIIKVEGGAINATGRFGVAAAGNKITYTQTGGTITVCMVGNASATLCSFDLGTSLTSVVAASAGTVIIQNVSTGTTLRDYRYQGGLGITDFTGSFTLQIGNALTPSAKSFLIYGVAPNLVIDGTFGHTVTWGAPCYLE